MPLKTPAGEGLSSIWQKFFQIVAECCAATDLCLVPRQEWSERGASIVPACALACGRDARAPRTGTMGIDAEPRGGRVPRQETWERGKMFGLPAQGARARPWARMCNRYAVGGGGTRWAVGWTPVWCVRRMDGLGHSGGGGIGFGRWAGGMGSVRPGGGVGDGFSASGDPGCAVRPWARMCNRYAVGRRGTREGCANPLLRGGRVKRRRPHVGPAAQGARAQIRLGMCNEILTAFRTSAARAVMAAHVCATTDATERVRSGAVRLPRRRRSVQMRAGREDTSDGRLRSGRAGEGSGGQGWGPACRRPPSTAWGTVMSHCVAFAA
jgi:hypothetical protein